jgi:uncharacterized protein involved in type VI secretion and phage assembly
MSGHGDLENLILSTVERVLAGRRSERHGLVTSYDPDKHLAKVTFMPEGQESGWLPIETGHIGNGFGIAVGLTPGDGKKTGDQVIVRYQEGDFESGKIVQRVHSDQDKPPKVQSGEAVLWFRFTKTAKGQSGLSDDTTQSSEQTGEQGGQQGTGAQIFFKNDGSLTVTDGAGASWVADGKGNITHTSKNKTDNFSGDRSHTVGGSDTVSIGKDKTVTIKGKRNDTVKKVWGAVAQFGKWSWLTSGSDESD